MFLTQKYSQISPFPNPNLNKLSKPIDETLTLKRLTSLLNSSPFLSLSALAGAVDLLSSTLTSFSNLLSDPALSRSEPDIAALASYLDSSLPLLDAVNSLSALIAALSRRRLHLSFALHLLRQRAELTRKARDSLAEWSEAVTTPVKGAADLIFREPPRGRATAVQRAIECAEAVSALVIGIVFSFLGGKSVRGSISVPSEVNGVLTEVGWKKGSLAAEIEAVGLSVTELTAASGDVARLKDLTEEAEKRTEELTAGLDRLDNAVNGAFRAALCARNTALQGFRIGSNKGK